MTPFAEFRMWLRDGPAAERKFVAVVGVLAMILLIWATVPQGSSTSTIGTSGGLGTGARGGQSTEQATAPAGAAGAAGAVANQGPTPQGVSTSGGSANAPTATAGNAGPQTSSGAGGGCPASSAKGVTNNQILVGVDVVDLGSLNAGIQLPSYDDFVKAYNAVFDNYNKAGGVQCRKLVGKYYRDNVLDASSEHAACTQMQQDGVFAVLNNLYNPQETTCVAQEKIPNLWYTPPHTNAMHQYYPYLMSNFPDYDRLVQDYVSGAQQLNWFAGMNKLGILEQTCYPDLNSDIERDLSAIGIGGGKIVRYNYGCNTTSVPAPSDSANAAVQFKSAGVTHVLSTAYDVIQLSFAQAAEQQGYRPKYAVMEDAEVSASDHSNPAPPQSFDGALAITTDQVGAADTPGVPVSPATAVCTKILSSVGLAGPVTPGTDRGNYLGEACAQVAMFVTAASHAQSLTRESLATGLSSTGPFDMSYPVGPAVFTDPNDPTAGQFWRPLNFHHDCNCWKVADPNFRRGA